MKIKILAKLKAKFAGLPNDYLETVAETLAASVTEESAIDGAIDGVSPLIETFIKFSEKETDRRVTTAVKTNTDNLKKEVKEKHGIDLDVTPKKETPSGDDVPSWAKGLIETVTTLNSKFAQIDTERTSKTQAEKLTGIFKEKSIPEKFYKLAVAGRTFKDDDELNSFAQSIVTSYEEFAQDSTSEGMNLMSPPAQGSKEKDGVSTAVKEFVSEKTSEASKPQSTVGGKIL